MPASAKCTSVRRDATGQLSVQFEDGTGQTFGSIEEIRQHVAPVDQGEEGVELARKILLARWLRTDPDGSDTAAILNRTCTINPGATNPVQIG